jgi:hypothetical protein
MIFWFVSSWKMYSNKIIYILGVPNSRHLWQGSICEAKILITYWSDIVSFITAFYCVSNLLSYLECSNEFGREANPSNIFWIQLSFIPVTWPMPANRIPFRWIYLKGISKICCWDLPCNQIH